jgi:integrase
VARQWLDKTAASRKDCTRKTVTAALDKDILPFIGNRPISTIGPRDVLAAVQRMETRGAIASAHRAKRICGQIFRFAVASGFAERDVTADLKGALTVIPQGNYAAIIEPKEVAGLLRAIDAYPGYPYAAAALKLAPLVFLRPGELRSAEWTEIDLDGAEWRIPATKMKMQRGHIVPLSRQAVALLRSIHPVSGHGKYVFPSIRGGARCMSDTTLTCALRYMGYGVGEMTAHGFRAMARTIMDEVLSERVDLVEHQLSHVVKDPNGNAYNRTKHLPQRRAMMQRWADYLDKLKTGADIMPFYAEAA